MKRQSRSFEIALSAIACAVAAAALTIGSYVDVFLAAGYVLAAFALMIPLAKRLVWGSALAFVGAVLLAFCFGAFARFWLLFPFLIFFGPHPIVNHLQRRHVRHIWGHALVFLAKAAWFTLSMWATWELVLVPLFGVAEATWYDWVMQYFYYVLFLGGTLVFAVYDVMIFMCQRSADYFVARIRR